MGELAKLMDVGPSQVAKDYPFIGRLYLVAISGNKGGRSRSLKAYNSQDDGDPLVEITYSSSRSGLVVQVGDSAPREELSASDRQLVSSLHEAFMKDTDSMLAGQSVA